VNVLARACGATVVVVDAGALTPVPGVLDRRIAAGTNDIAAGPAMTLDEAWRAIANGLKLAGGLRAGTIVVPGEMGIGNTTSAAALTSVFSGLPPRAVTGRGTGLDDAAFAGKVEAVELALQVNKPSPDDPLAVLAKVGGFEIATLAGVIIGTAARRCAILLDGFISCAAALVATALDPGVSGYLQAGHRSAEPGHDAALRHLGLDPILDLGLRLGEGSGGALAIPVLEAARALLVEMATFEEAGVSRGEPVMDER
jgi:nicotinate-nucleotide--dimethylbenzimidazole phosphoribosyltransferase